MSLVSRPDTKPATRHPSDVAVTVVSNELLLEFGSALRTSPRVAVDTETVFVDNGIGQLRVVSAATRDHNGQERAWVVDAARIDCVALAVALSGISCDAWNADFDARVIDRDLLEPARNAGEPIDDITWWDAQIADALLHQGLSGFGFYHGLAWATENYLGLTAEGKGTTQLSYRAEGVLTDEQLRYAAADAVETLWVGDVLRPLVSEAGLDAVCELEMGARPFLDHMERAGLPFNWDGWEGELDQMRIRQREVVSHLANLTGGGQGSLFSEHVEPSWNPGSERQSKGILNRHAETQVRAWTKTRHSEDRLLLPTDPLRATTLSEIGGELCETMLEYRELAKVLSTYGEGIRDHLDPDGRVRPEYLQVVGTNTGRLASRNPNAQNLSPRMKPYFTPTTPNRVFVHADLSQAELRFVAEVSEDSALRQAFVDGVDVHVATAEAMFGISMADVAENEPEQYQELRAKAKRINFGIVYGQRGAGLARSLSLSGVETSAEEGRSLLDAYLSVYRGVSAWCDERDEFIDRLQARPGAMNWTATLRLHALWREVRDVRRSFREFNRRWPSAEEVTADPTLNLSLEEVAWILGFHAPIVLDEHGDLFGFASHTRAGRRQQFTFHTEGILSTAAATIVRSPKPGPMAIRSRLEQEHNINFRPGGIPLTDGEITKILENRALRRAVIDAVADEMGSEAQIRLLDGALRERISQMANAYRNAPIQGGVADVMLDAYGALHAVLRHRPGVDPIQTVHDSVVVECEESEAPEVAKLVKATLEEAMARWCPNVPAVADTDVRRSLSDHDIIFELS